jgi:hypothetical protein
MRPPEWIMSFAVFQTPKTRLPAAMAKTFGAGWPLLAVVSCMAACQSPGYSRLKSPINHCGAGGCVDSRVDEGGAEKAAANPDASSDVGRTDGGAVDHSSIDLVSDIPAHDAESGDTKADTASIDAGTAPVDAATDILAADLSPERPLLDATPESSASDAGNDSARADSGPTDGSVARCSVRGGPSVALTFRNALPSTSVIFDWVNFSCDEVEYARVAPGHSFQVSTFGAHVWHVRDLSGNLLKELLIDSAPTTQNASVP